MKLLRREEEEDEGSDTPVGAGTTSRQDDKHKTRRQHIKDLVQEVRASCALAGQMADLFHPNVAQLIGATLDVQVCLCRKRKGERHGDTGTERERDREREKERERATVILSVCVCVHVCVCVCVFCLCVCLVCVYVCVLCVLELVTHIGSGPAHQGRLRIDHRTGSRTAVQERAQV